MRTIVAVWFLMKLQLERKRRDGRDTGFVETETERTVRPVWPAWMSVSSV